MTAISSLSTPYIHHFPLSLPLDPPSARKMLNLIQPQLVVKQMNIGSYN